MSIEDEILAMEKKGCITVAKAAEQANRTAQTIYEALKRGDLRGVEKAGRTYVLAASLVEWTTERPTGPQVEKRGRRASRR